MSYVEQMQENLVWEGSLRERCSFAYAWERSVSLTTLGLVNGCSTFLLGVFIGLEVKRSHLWFPSAAICKVLIKNNIFLLCDPCDGSNYVVLLTLKAYKEDDCDNKCEKNHISREKVPGFGRQLSQKPAT